MGNVTAGSKISFSHLQVALNNLQTNQNNHCPANYTSWLTGHNSRANAFYSSHLNGHNKHYTSWNASWRTADYDNHYEGQERNTCDKHSVDRNGYNVSQYAPVEDNYYPSDKGGNHSTHYESYNSVTYAHYSAHQAYNRGHCTSNHYDRTSVYSGFNASRQTQYSSKYTGYDSANYGHNSSYLYSNRRGN